ncbi:MAG: alcohol dehydrogenase catalytic domain-containing protein, partial [Microbacteriaceae bacterium]|nr:alcohol dehydrogenase catalytic domain-containing protein [Microbacteriaceae bacterium]
MRTEAALARHGQAELALEVVEIDEPGPGEILVEMVAVGLCHTDEAMRHTWPEQRTPMVFGHEGVGRVLRVGEGVDHLVPGDEVVLSFPSCGRCGQCLAGAPAYCRELPKLGASGLRASGQSGLRLAATGETVYGGFFGQSSFARHALAYARSAILVPQGIDLSAITALGCSAITGAGAVINIMRPTPADSVVVFGAGAVGLAAVMAAVALGVHQAGFRLIAWLVA